MRGNRSCKEFIELYKDARVNCATCRYWTGKECNDIEKVIEAQQKEHDYWDGEMRHNKAVFLT